MKTTNTITFPTDIATMRAAVKAAIEMYQGSPVKKDNKLNEALAVALEFKNYDQLSACLSAQQADDEITPYTVSFDYSKEQQLIINYVRIDTELAHNEEIRYTVIDREERVSDLRMWIAEAQNNPQRAGSVHLMQQDLDTLLASNADWALERVGTNGFIAPDLSPKEFNEACDEVLAAAAAYYQKLIGTASKTGTCYQAEEFYGSRNIEIYAGELVLLHEDVLSDGNFPIGMAVRKFEGEVLDGYIAAYAGSDGEYVPVTLNNDN